MPDYQFLLALKVSDHPQFDALLDDLAESVLKHVGYGSQAIADILATLREGLAEDATGEHRDGDVQFRAEAGRLHIVVSYGGGREWRVARALPD